MTTDLMIEDEAPPAPRNPAPAAPAPRRSRWPLLALAAVMLLFLVWGGQKYLYSRTHVSTDNAQVDGHLTPVAPKVQAFVAQVLVDDNQPVRFGDTLVVLDDQDFRARLAQAEADLAAARSQVGTGGRAGQAVAQLEAARSTAGGADAAVQSAEAAWRKANSDLERYRGLAAQGIVSAQQLDAAQAAFDGAQANLETARRQSASTASQVVAAEAALRGADARLAQAEAAVQISRLQVGYTRITAPVDGIVARRTVESGELVQVGQELLTVVPLGDVWVTANLKETQLQHVTPGDPVEFSVDAYKGAVFEGRVESLSPATGARFALLPPDNATGNYTKVVQRVPVKITVTRAPAGLVLRPGMSAEVTITTR